MEETKDSNISTPKTGGEGGGINKDDSYKVANDNFGVALMQLFENRIAEVEQAVELAVEYNCKVNYRRAEDAAACRSSCPDPRLAC